MDLIPLYNLHFNCNILPISVHLNFNIYCNFFPSHELLIVFCCILTALKLFFESWKFVLFDKNQPSFAFYLIKCNLVLSTNYTFLILLSYNKLQFPFSYFNYPLIFLL